MKELDVLKETICNQRLRLLVNDRCLDDIIEGFKTLNIFGRTIAKKNVSVSDSDVFDGGYITSNTYSPRIITVEYLLKGRSNSDFIRKFELLNFYLRGNLKLKVSDDSFYYYGVLKDITDIEDVTNWVVGKFEIICCDPYKYSDDFSISFDTSYRFTRLYMYEAILESVMIAPNKSSDGVSIKNKRNGKQIKIEGPISQGDKIKINCLEQKITINNQNALNRLNIISNLEDFELKLDDLITISVSGECKISFRERRL